MALEDIDISDQEETQETQENSRELQDVDISDTGAETQEETTQESTEETQDEHVVDENTTEAQQEDTNESSLTSEQQQAPEQTAEQQTTETTEQTQQEVQIDDSMVQNYLSEKLGITVESLEDLKKPEVENPLDSDEQLKEIAEWRKRTGRPITDWFKFQEDYEAMSDVEVVRKNLQLKYPNLTPEELELEMSDLIADPDVDTDEEVARKNLRIKKMAPDARKELNSLKSEFDTPVTPVLDEQTKEAVDFYQKYKEEKPKADARVEAYKSGLKSEASKLDTYPLQLSDDLSIDYKLTPEDKQALPTLAEKMPHWYNQDGTFNHSAIVKDTLKIKNFEQMVKLAYQQGEESGKEKADKEDRNINFDQARQTHTQDTRDEIQVEGADNMSGGTLKFGRNRNY